MSASRRSGSSAGGEVPLLDVAVLRTPPRGSRGRLPTGLQQGRDGRACGPLDPAPQLGACGEQ
eukprot:3829822-Pyramimonas_sp.AAC.1